MPGVVAEALAGLWAPHRRVIVELYYRGCTIAEAAVMLGITPAMVKSLARYAVYALRLALEERDVAP